MASMRNAYKSGARAHKERNQPAARKKLGLLEKHKDYVVRAKDFHKKEKVVQTLREKAALKNPDEFYFKMTSTQTEDGIHKVRRSSKRTHDALKLMKRQDMNYLVQKSISEDKKICRLRESLGAVVPAHQRMNTHKQLDQDCLSDIETEELPSGRNSSKPKRQAELDARIKRKELVDKEIKSIQMQRHLMGKGKRRKIRGAVDIFGDEIINNTPTYRWKQERKK